MIDEQRGSAFPHGQVRGLAGLVGQRLQVLVAEGDQDVAPVVLSRQAPDGGPENVVLPAVRIGEEAAALQRGGQAEDAAPVDAEQIGQRSQRYGVGRSGDGFQNGQAAIEALNGWCLKTGFSHGWLFSWVNQSIMANARARALSIPAKW